jgi:hypothetical protein
MEGGVQLFLRVGGAEKPLTPVPVNFEELLKAVNKATGVFNFNVKLAGQTLSNSRDLIVAYLNNRNEHLTLDIEEIVPDMSGMDPASQAMFQSMMDKFKGLEEAQAQEPMRLENGALTKQDLLRVIKEMSVHAQRQLAESTGKFQARRQELYGEEEKYRNVVMEQLQFQEMLILSSTMDVCNRFGISPDIFDASCGAHIADPSVRAALESMAVEALQVQVDLPESLTRERLREVLTTSCRFLNQYVDEHPNMNPIDTVILKMRESDEVLRQFGYTETQVSTALGKYNLESDPYWEDMRETMGRVTGRLFRNQGGYGPGMMPQ